MKIQYNAPLFVLYAKFEIFAEKNQRDNVPYIPALYYVQSMILKQILHYFLFLQFTLPEK
jgi:hypothetical protein